MASISFSRLLTYVLATSISLAGPALYAQTGQVLSFQFNEYGGTVAADSSGNNNTATLANGAVFSSGHTGNGVQFAQLANPVDVMTVPASASLNSITRDITIAAWVYRTGDGSGYGNALIGRQIGTGAMEPYVLAYLPGGGMHFLVNTQGLGYSQEGAAPAVPLNEWHEWVGTYDGSQVKFYKDGVLQWSVNHAGGNLAAELNNPLAIGGGFNTATTAINEPFVGKMDDIQLYNRALSATEVQSLYSGALPPPDTSVPSIPQGLAATAVSSSQINLSWNASTDNVGVAGYRIFRSGTAVGTTTATSYSDTGLGASTSYVYTVAAYDAADNESVQSSSASATTFAPPPPPSGDNVIYLPLNENVGTTAVDQSGNGNDGTLTNGATWTTGITGSGVAFDGANDYVRIPSSASVNSVTSAITVAAWVYRSSNQSGWATVATRQTGTTPQEHFFLGFDNSGNYRWFVSTTAGYSSTTLGGVAPLQQWVHVVGTYDGATVRFYVNGVQNFSTPESGAFTTDTTPVMLGGSFNDATTNVGEPFAGRIDEFHLYNRALSATEVQSLYTASAPPVPPPSAGQIVSLALNESSGTMASDSSGNNNNGIMANGAVFGTGHTGNGVQFAQLADPVDVITVPASASLNSITNGLTVAVWAYPTGNGSNAAGWNALITRQIGTGGTQPFALTYNTGINGCCTAGMHFVVNTPTLGYSSEGRIPAVPLNEWHHWVGTYNGSQVKLYMDGSLMWSVNYAGGNLAVELNNPLSIGGCFDGSTGLPHLPFVGKLDDVQVYNRALGGTEVQSLYNNSVPPLDMTVPSIPQGLAAKAVSASQINLAWGASTDNVGVVGYRVYRGGMAIGTTSSTSYNDTGLAASVSFTYRVTAYDAANNESGQSIQAWATTSALQTQPLPISGQVLYLPLNQSSGTTATDASGLSNAGTLLGGAAWTTGKSAGGVQFDGVNGRISVPSSSSINAISSGITVAAWVYRNVDDPNTATVVTRQKGTTPQEYFYLGFINGNYRWFVNTLQSGYSSTTLGGAAPFGQWVHMAGTYDGSSVKLYVNGVQQFSTPLTGLLASDTTPVMIGASYNGASQTAPAELLNGKVDDVQIFDHALTAAEIVSMYQQTAASGPPPSVSITSPTPGSVAGTITLAASASDDTGVAGVQFAIDGVSIGPEQPAAPYQLALNTTWYANGTHTLTAIARDSSGNTTASAPVTVSFSNATPKPLGRIMPLGDSITYGTVTCNSGTPLCADPLSLFGGYRKYLWEKLLNNGIASMDFVGSQVTGVVSMDRRHEAHNGWRCDELTPYVAIWLSEQHPDAILLMCGTNDIGQGADSATTLNRLATLIDTIYGNSPSVRLFVASIPPVAVFDNYAHNAQQIAAYNSGIPTLVNTRAAQGKNISFVDVYRLASLDTSATTSDYSADGTHPSLIGYSKVANVWYTSLTQF